MSTAKRYRRIVWDGICAHQRSHENGEAPMWASAITVGERAGVSPKTARKYLKELAAKGKVHEMNAGASSFYMIAFEG